MSQFDILEAFKKELWDLENHWYLFIDLYGHQDKERRREVLMPSHPLLFDTIKRRLHDHVLLVISRLLDPEKTCGKDNLSLQTLISEYEPFSAEAGKAIERAKTEITSNFSKIKVHRNKRISHNDLGNKLNSDLPIIQIKEIESIIDDLELVFNTISIEKRNRHHEFFPRNLDENYKADHLLDILEAGRKALSL
ncbi:AbiU2 domain-containing protein [Aliivibrio fischeri]|uniref:AbiU2 domain-containing protein n=1 Tax=Aliivibrio fischeri TaxID=668 RepID=UPI000907DBAF|nr:hypothetical protein [Aliivibrio fischeri]